jgi:hypothetical protein
MKQPLICWFRFLWYNLTSMVATVGLWSGCCLVEEEVIKNATVTVFRCKDCGKVDVSWER